MINKKVKVFWEPLNGIGLEHLEFSKSGDGIYADGVVIGSRNGHEFRLHYSIICDAHNKVRDVQIELLGKEKRQKYLKADGQGNWFDENNRLLSDLSGCYEVDISATPFTNTLAINRLGLSKGQSSKIQVVYIPIPDLNIQPVPQRYTCLEKNLYRYEGLFRQFEANLPLDENGLVIDYPETFCRIQI